MNSNKNHVIEINETITIFIAKYNGNIEAKNVQFLHLMIN
jgi:hypothetical protein